MKTKIIVNPMANKGNCGKRWPHLLAELESNLGPLAADDVAMTRSENHASLLAREAVGAGYRRLISIGGDGAFSEILNGVISDDRPIAPDLVLRGGGGPHFVTSTYCYFRLNSFFDSKKNPQHHKQHGLEGSITPPKSLETFPFQSSPNYLHGQQHDLA